jgi:rhodanese-related sulfurtransferase
VNNKKQAISPTDLQALRDKGEQIEVIDVRTPFEFREFHLDIAQNIPLDKLNPDAVVRERKGRKSEPLYIICRSGSRGLKACQKFIDCGHKYVINIEGGTLAASKSGLPMVNGKKAVSLDRQVRIAAGLIVFLGVILSWQIHHGFLLIPGLIGLGLTFSGVTDTCGMATLLSKMPWNA